MDFPETYASASIGLLERFRTESREASPVTQVTMQTGTTVIALMNPDRTVGVIASDGRVSMLPFVAQDNFRKFWACQIGFIGAAGSLALIQRAIPAFIADLDYMTESRKRPMTASGTARRLFQYALAAGGAARGSMDTIATLPLFWDHDERHVRIYSIEGGAFLRKNYFHSIGSGSTEVLPHLRRDFRHRSLPETKDGLMAVSRELLLENFLTDIASGGTIFFGIIENGKFDQREEPR